METAAMILLLRTMIVVAMLATGVPRSSAQPVPATPSLQEAALDETKQLSQRVAKLDGESRFQEAVAPAERALALREKTLGPMHPDVAQSLNNLAGLYQEQGAYGKAEPLYVRALEIREKALGPTHPDVAQSLNNLAEVYRRQGAYEKAATLYAHALDISEKALGPTHPEVAASLNNLALLYQAQGAYGKAKPLYIRALAISEKALGPTHPNVAKCLNNLAELHNAQGEYGKAEPLLVRALAINEKVLGPRHPEVATSLNNLAVLYREQGANGKVELACTTTAGWFFPVRAARSLTRHVRGRRRCPAVAATPLGGPGRCPRPSGTGNGRCQPRRRRDRDGARDRRLRLVGHPAGRAIGVRHWRGSVFLRWDLQPAAGAASQVVSLWSVSDASTRQLMRDYYGELAKGTGRAEALRQAKLHLMRQPRYAHPFYCAAFIPAGDWRPLGKNIFSSRRPGP